MIWWITWVCSYPANPDEVSLTVTFTVIWMTLHYGPAAHSWSRLILNLTEGVLELFSCESPPLIVVTSTWGNSLSRPMDTDTKKWTRTPRVDRACVSEIHLHGKTNKTLRKWCKWGEHGEDLVFTWQLSVSSVLLLMFQCRVTVMWRLQMGFLCRTIVPLIKSPTHTLTGLSSINRVCFQCVGLRRGEKENCTE